jgi:hypothetical protein
MKTLSLFLLFANILFFDSCDLFDSANEEKLPPATQEGKNTFGCLVNGKVWLPKGYDGTSNLDLSYDPTFNHGTFDLRTYRYLDEKSFQYLILFSDSIASTGSFKLEKFTHQFVTFYDANRCVYRTEDQDVTCEGLLEITKFDLQNFIISGTFEFTMTKDSCETMKVTEGRFDMKF